MRNVKFRVWLKEKEEMVYVKNIIFNDLGVESIEYNGTIYYPDDFVLMQSLEYQDVNESDIFDGDIIKDRYGVLRVIEWCEEEFCYKGRDIYNIPGKVAECIWSDEIRKCEVVGNIYSNPELLKKQEEREQYYEDATSGDYENLLKVSIDMIDKCNERIGILD